MPWVINEAGESVWQDPNQGVMDWANQFYNPELDVFNINGQTYNVASPWADFQNYAAHGEGSTPEAFRAKMYEGGGEVIDTPAGQLFVGKSRQDAPEMSAEPGAGFGGMLPGILTGALTLGTSFGSGFLGDLMKSFETAGATGGANLPSNYWNMVADAGGTVTDVGAGGYGDFGGVDALNSFDTGEMASVLDGGMPGAGGWGDPFMDAYTPIENLPKGSMLPAATTTAGGGNAITQAINKVFGSSLTDGDTKMIGDLIAGGLGVMGSRSRADAISGEGARLDAMQAPWRARLSDLYANPSSFLTSAPVAASIDQGTEAVSRALSTKYGNPALAPNAVAEISKYANNSLYDKFGQEANRLAAFGGLNFPATSTSNLNIGAADADSGVYDAIGATIGSVFAPKKQMTAAELLRMLNSGNLYSQSVAA